MTKLKKGDIIKTPAGCHYLVLRNDNSYRIDVKPAPPELNLKVAKRPVPWFETYTTGNKVIGNINDMKKEIEMTKLYEFDDLGIKKYGTKIAVNSEGKWVLEVKGTGEVLAKDKDELTEVIPYSILVQPHYSKNKVHMMAEKGKYQVGELYVSDNSEGFAIYKVCKTDTKTHCNETFKPTCKLLTEGF
jgi:hypothetical protein